ncbi:hypothetical protein GKZ89_16865 [Bacillus mangrovi]|uniref:Uncharacterized protein n=1 Tax=Metabacillus mangrovi TaxID=1491830 RepID=A0A7X2V6H6_9BACI|nr:hypothetical protein [Metabacillus mangrovi]MTH55078.1 hypothetical protein [Metabacillus mangrovi]
MTESILASFNYLLALLVVNKVLRIAVSFFKNGYERKKAVFLGLAVVTAALGFLKGSFWSVADTVLLFCVLLCLVIYVFKIDGLGDGEGGFSDEWGGGDSGGDGGGGGGD